MSDKYRVKLSDDEIKRADAGMKEANKTAESPIYQKHWLRKLVVAGMDALKLPFPKAKRGKSK